MGWIIGVLVFLGSLLLYVKGKDRKIQKLEKKSEILQQKVYKAETEQKLQNEVNEILDELQADEIEHLHDKQTLQDTIPEDHEELSDEGKQSAAAISSHILERQRRRVQDRK